MKKIYVNGRFLTQKTTGTQRFAIEITKELIKHHPNVEILVPEKQKDDLIYKDFAVTGVEHFKNQVWEQVSLYNFLKKQDDYTLLNFSFTGPYFCKKSIVCVHDIIFTNRNWVSKKFYYYYNFLVPKLAKRALRVLTVSEFSKNEINAQLNIPLDKIEVVYNSVSKEFKENADSEFGKNYGMYFLGVSSLNPRKNFEGLIEGFNNLQLQDVKLVIAGAKNKKIYGETMLGENNSDKIVFTGYVSDSELASLYKYAVAFVYPSYYEGFGLPPIEAMSMGCPVITSDTSSLPEVCADAVIYVNPEDTPSISNAIQTLHTDESKRKELIGKGYERVKYFSWEKSAKKIISIVQSL
ncbi:MAG: glycosyltransferase family 4 protein [Fibrobacterales bacterium]